MPRKNKASMDAHSQYVQNANSVSRSPKRRVKQIGGSLQTSIASARGGAARVN